MIKRTANIEIINPKLGAKAVYYPLKDEVLTGVLYSETVDITIVINGTEILLQSFKGVSSKKLSPDKKIFRLSVKLEQPVIIKAKSPTPSTVKVFFLTEIQPK